MFDATHLQNVQPTATVNVAEKSNFQVPIIRESPIGKASTFKPANAVLVHWKFFGIWILELGISRRIANSAGLDCARELQ